jgi:hypothetical protein
MALTSPGVDVQVIDESFYTPAEPGTVPIIFVATGENKLNGAGTGIAPGTTKANAGKPYLLTSQRELVDTFGDPTFYVDNNNNPIHGGEQNEYGLQAAYSYLGVSNRAYVVRADIDLNGLNASSTATTANPASGTYWLDTATSRYGVFEWDGSAVGISNTSGQTFSNKTPTVITDTTKVVDYSGADYTPLGSVGAVGDYALVAVTTIPTLWYKNTAGTWVVVGSANWKASWPSVTGTGNVSGSPFTPGDQLTVNQTDGSTQIAQFSLTGSTGATFVSDFNTAMSGTGISAAVVSNRIEFYNTGATHDGFQFAATGTIFTVAGLTGATNYYAPKLQASAHTSVPEFKSGDTTPRPTGSVWIKTTTPNAGANWSVKVWNSDTELWDTSAAPIYATNHAAIAGLDASGGGANLTSANLYVQTNVTEAAVNLADFTIYKRAASGATSIMSVAITTGTITAGTGDFTISESVKGSDAMSTPVTVSFTAAATAADAETLANAINAAGLTNVTASVATGNKVMVSHALGGEIRIADTNSKFVMAFPAWNYTNSTGTANFYDLGSSNYNASLWKELTYTASDEAPTALAEDGALWYSSVIDEIDIMVHDGSNWKGYTNEYASADPAGPIVSATEPTKQNDGTSALVTGDLWVSTADLENFPRIYRWNDTLSSWIELDTTDQTTENGVIFADARYNTAGSTSGTAGDIADLLGSDYLDPDAPDPALYPKGMLLWNTRRSGFNVKRFERNYIDISTNNTRGSDSGNSMAAYYPHRWVTESANDADGSGSFGRKAQRKVVVQKLQSLLNENQDIRDDESRVFNLIATPGYPELIGEMITLNYDRGLTAFVIGDSPMRLTSDATSLNEWATNVNAVVEDNDNGLVSRDEYLGVYYPSGFTSDNAGNNIVVPSSHMVLRTFALNDQVAFPWFAPAGTRRGGVTNATSTGFINAEGEFVATALNEGVRDTLYANNVNPITFLTGAGLVVFGQKTRARNASALDRINVARLVVYLRSQLNTLAKPYLFEPNDKITRDEIKQQVESLLVELVGLRALFDFLVVCDETNNTPARIDRNELYVDIAIEPVKAVEFIYIPLRIKNTGEISGL